MMSRPNPMFRPLLPALFCGLIASPAFGAQTDVESAVTKGLAVLAQGTRDYEEHRSCFTCHHQTLPMLAQATAKKNGFSIDQKLFDQQTRITHDGFKNRHDKLLAGKGIGGQSMTVGYALWALHLADWKPDQTTDAMTAYLIKTQRKDGGFYTNKKRPPQEDSPFTSATIAAYYLDQFVSDARRNEADAVIARARGKLIRSEPARQEDLNARLWGLHILSADKKAIKAARRAVLDAQRPDGGWGQLPDMESDSYATGQALWMLQETGGKVSSPAYRRGVAYLLKTQREDGSWFVETRSHPIQTYFESGFPHGKDQFISICGTSWAVAALAASVERD